MGTLKISLDDSTVATYHNASRHERSMAKRVFSFFIRRDTKAHRALLETTGDLSDNPPVAGMIGFLCVNQGFELGYAAHRMAREEMNAR